MPSRLSGMDAAWLYLETPTSHMHVGSVIVLDPATRSGQPLDRGALAAYVASRLHLAPLFRQRLVQVPLRLDRPVWIRDPDFDLDFHVRRAALPAPGDMATLAEFAGDVMSRQLDRARPLWELYVVEGLVAGPGDGSASSAGVGKERLAIVVKTHHAAIDGISGMELTAAMLQLHPDQEVDPPTEPWEPERVPSDGELLAGAGLRLATLPLGALRTGRQALESLTGLLRVGEERRDEPPPAPFAAPTMPWNGAIGPHRRVAFASVPLPAVKAVKDARGGTVNDVVLALVAGALRAYLVARDLPRDRPLVAMVPISVRGTEQEDQGPNQVSAMLVGLPVDEPDPLRRLARIAAGTKDAKQQHGALGATTLQQVAELAPAALSSLAARLYTRMRAADHHRPIWNVVVSNVPGPRFPLYLAGARVEAMYPLGPVHEMNGLNITLFSYEQRVFVGLNADRELLGDVDRVAAALPAALRELDVAGGGRR
ncbi:MAG: wax ester/triacylglycerol synthase family O-acyltransferase [Euzebyales bacterium]|nr:wax ester/triacylglycerol synthase family O-acyltransferase [Euzebyales bacterium]